MSRLTGSDGALLAGRDLIVVLISYALGCVSAGYYLVRLRTGEDIRRSGSGSAGARNVGRTLGVRGFFITFAIDVAKGALAVGLARAVGSESWVALAAMLTVVAGHVWPAQLGFRGGKGMATGLGALLAFDPVVAVVALVVAAALFAASRHFTFAGLVAVGACPVFAALLGADGEEIAGLIVVAALIIVAHRTNIRAMIDATRLRAGGRAPGPPVSKGSPR